MNLRLTTTLLGEARTWVLEDSPTRAGRASTNGIRIPDGTVSKEHAEFVLVSGRWHVRDLGSRNGSRLNGRPLAQAEPIQPGDTIEIGQVVLRASDAAPEGTILGGSPTLNSSVRLKVPDLLQRTATVSDDSPRVMRLLQEAGRLLVLPRPLPETCEILLEFVERAVPCNRLVMLLREREGDELAQVAARTRGASFREPLALSKSIIRTVLEENTAVITGDALRDPRFMAQHSIVAQAIHSAMAVPLWDNERVLGILYVDSTQPTTIYDQPQLELLTLLANISAMKITNALLLRDEEVRKRLAQELGTATRIQQALLPGPPRGVDGWSFHARIETCNEVGGDLYDFHRRDDGALVIMVGDVTGKGMGAALMMSSMVASARVLYDACDGPLALVRRLNGVMHRGSDGRSFVTLFVGWLDPATGKLRYVNAGHPEGCVVGGGKVRSLEATGIPVGMLPDFAWTEGEDTLAPGEILSIFSDGIPEAQRGEEFFDMDRVKQALCAAVDPDLDEAAARVVRVMDEFSGGQHRSDDVTLVMLRRE